LQKRREARGGFCHLTKGGAGKELVYWWFSLADVRDGGGGKERMNRERDMIKKKRRKTREEGCFCSEFGLQFLHAQNMKSTPIYRGWKRVILSSLGKSFSP